MNNYRVTIKHTAGKQTNLISTTIPANDGKAAIEKVKSANSIEDANVLSKKAELLTSK
jgi:hypothetical protein